MISDSAAVRKELRSLYQKEGVMTAAAAKDEDSVYSGYYEFTQPVGKLAGHQILAVNRGEKEGFLKVKISVEKEKARLLLERRLLKPGSPSESFVRGAIDDGYER